MLTAATPGARLESDAAGAPGENARGWYLYGITKSVVLADVLNDVNNEIDADTLSLAGAGPLQLLDCAGLVAVVRPVWLADFRQAIARERLRDEDELETIARRHNRVVEAIHARRVVLPAKFGMVYARADDIVSAVASARDSLESRLDRFDGCDEWALHLYADPAAIRERLSVENSAIRRLREEHSSARPGRAFFLERQIRDALETATRETLAMVAEGAFDELANLAVASQIDSFSTADNSGAEPEVLRAAFLIPRASIDRFKALLRVVARPNTNGLRPELSGPWAPYSFAALDQRDAR